MDQGISWQLEEPVLARHQASCTEDIESPKISNRSSRMKGPSAGNWGALGVNLERLARVFSSPEVPGVVGSNPTPAANGYKGRMLVYPAFYFLVLFSGLE